MYPLFPLSLLLVGPLQPCGYALYHQQTWYSPPSRSHLLEKYGGKIEYNSVNDLFEDYKAEKLSPQDLKLSVTEYLNALLEPMRQSFETNTVWQKAREEGYGEKKVEKKACIFPSFLFLIPSDQRCPPCLPSSIQSRSNHQDLGAGGQW